MIGNRRIRYFPVLVFPSYIKCSVFTNISSNSGMFAFVSTHGYIENMLLTLNLIVQYQPNLLGLGIDHGYNMLNLVLTR